MTRARCLRMMFRPYLFLTVQLLHLVRRGFSFGLVDVSTSRFTWQRRYLPFSLTALPADYDNDDGWISKNVDEVIGNDAFELEEEEWMSDREKARLKLHQQEGYQSTFRTLQTEKSQMPMLSTVDDELLTDTQEGRKVSPYTDEEEEVIRAMGGKNANAPRLREPGYLGDSTLDEIARDYSVPVCYLADVLTMWGVPVPINVHDRLGDLVTGEQAFAILEAVNSIDVAALHDRSSNQSLLPLCDYHDIDVTKMFEVEIQ